jgi:PPOX class probable F420-dependent enzyme
MSTPPPWPSAVLDFLRTARVGHLATVDAGGAPSVVPICFQVEPPLLFTPIDAKPKRGDWERLRRVRNLRANPAVAVVVDRWDEDWRRLGWVHLRGRAALVASGPRHARGVALLREKYAQYRAQPQVSALDERPLIVVTVTAVTHWGHLTPPPAPARA